MSEQKSFCPYIVDARGLRDIARMTGNEQATMLGRLQDGTIGVPTCVWDEFSELFEDEAALLKPFVGSKVSHQRKYAMKQASLVEELNVSFSNGPYDENTDIYLAAISQVEGCTILTVSSEVGQYSGKKGKAVDLHQWLADLAA